MRKSLVIVALAAALCPATASAQSIEMWFTSSVVPLTFTLKKTLKADSIETFGAATAGATAERARSHAEKPGGLTAVLIIGDEAMKASAHVDFRVPVIAVNTSAPTAAKKVIRVFDPLSAPPGAKAANAKEVAALIGGSDTALKGDVAAIVQAALSALKR